MPTLFHPPYQFIPVTGQAKLKVSYEEIAKGTSNYPIRHDMWQKNAYSGRLIASVYLETATVVGGQHEAQPNGPACVQSYCRNGQPAIPGNSLRGMIGSIAETLSQSALRILENKDYSVRKPIDSGSSLSALGLLRTHPHPTDKACLELLPITIPVQSAQTRQGAYQLGPLWKKVFNEGRTPLKFCLPAYISGYETVGKGDHARQQLVKESFLGKNPNLECFLGIQTTTKAPQFYYARLADQLSQPVGERILFSQSDPALKIKGGRILGQRIAKKDGIEDIITKAQFECLTPSEQARYTKGVLRILGIAGREEKIPQTKKYEFFIPLHKEQHLPIPKQVLDNFITLAKERETASEGEYPFKPQGYTDWHPQAGQLVFFDIAQDAQGQIYVSEISFSSIWRKRVEGSSHDFFRKIHQDCLPWNPDRNHLTPAECLFGVVEEKERDTDEQARAEEKKRDTDKQTRALASRLCFSDARAVGTVQLMPPVTLKILSSPKPPCPAMYFHPDNARQTRYIKKTELSYQKHRPNGRKVYLHHPLNEVNKAGKHQYWESCSTEHQDQKMRCQPMQKGQTFYFHIDFENLSQAELGLLLRSLSPDASYRHRLGLGKSLGLGTVAVILEGLFLIDRLQRYSLKGLDSPRYHQIFHGTSLPSSSLPWAQFYPQEAQVLTQATTSVLNTPFYTDTTLIDAQTLKILQTVGNPNSLHPQIPVSPPLEVGQQPEKETFKWFTENDRQPGRQAALPAIQAHQKLPTLK